MSEQRHHGGHVWSSVRQGLSRYRERLVEAFDAGSYEREAAILDDIARSITADIEPMVESYTVRSRHATQEGRE